MTPFERADEAKRLLENPILNQAFADIRMSLVAKLEDSPISDVETQHEIALMLQLLKKLRDQLQNYQNEQIIEEHKVRQDSFIEKMRERFKA